MKKFVLFVTALAIGVCTTTAADAKKKRKKRPPPVVSPTIHADRTVTFRIKAANAEKINVGGEFQKGRIPLVKGEDNIWTVTTGPIAPGLYGYNFQVDGLSTLDPGNRFLKPMRSPKTSILHIPGGNVFDFDPAIPHGTVHQHIYHSAPIKRTRELRIYTPPGYETGKDKYPLLVLQHGHSDSYATWTTYGKANLILDHLIAADKAVPMIVVMLDGHPIPDSYGNGRSINNVEELRRDLMEVVLPMVEKEYRVKFGRRNRAIAGLSMGGLHSLSIGLEHSQDFAWIGAFSAAVPKEQAPEILLADPAKLNKNLNLLWISIGKSDFLLEENHAFRALLQKQKIDHEFHLTEGGHSWPIWRAYLAQFAPRLFR
ncbi:MAG: alpha/beta hydrolase-fold protein [Limisphaerales bacterium]